MSAKPPALLLVNLGSPDSPQTADVRRYLREFLSDRRVIEAPRAVWWFVLHGIILPFRSPRSAKAYASIWDADNGEAPLKQITRRQAEGLREVFGDAVRVDWAMRYGQPSIAARLHALMAQGHERIVIFPLYPQYSATTTATVVDEVFRVLAGMRHQPTLRFVPPYYDHPAYIDALAESVQAAMAGLDWRPQRIIASYHGLPKTFVEKGDPYERHCMETSRLLKARLNLPDEMLLTTFQSRLGRAEWLQPYTDETLRRLAEEGVKNLLVITPAFAADCLETLEEIAIAGRETFLAHGGENYAVVPCLNATPTGLAMLATLARENMCGWVS